MLGCCNYDLKFYEGVAPAILLLRTLGNLKEQQSHSRLHPLRMAEEHH
jgi:hypothetical protein